MLRNVNIRLTRVVIELSGHWKTVFVSTRFLYLYCRNKLLLTEKATSMTTMQINCLKYLHRIYNFLCIVFFTDKQNQITVCRFLLLVTTLRLSAFTVVHGYLRSSRSLTVILKLAARVDIVFLSTSVGKSLYPRLLPAGHSDLSKGRTTRKLHRPCTAKNIFPLSYET